MNDTVYHQYYLEHTEIIDWQNPNVRALASRLSDQRGSVFTARNCFEWVRDEVRHSLDEELRLVTCSASRVLEEGHGLCYAKSHLLAALLRANGIAAGFSYQRLQDGPDGYCLHGFNGLYLPEIGWYRVDARGNKPGVNARFDPPQEHLAFSNTAAGEIDYGMILPKPWPTVVRVLHSRGDLTQLKLPDKIVMG